MERDLQTIYFQRAIKCASDQTLIITKYFKLLLCAYKIIENMSDNITVSKNHERDRRGDGEEVSTVLPQNFNKFITSLELRVVKLLEYLSP